MPINKVIYGSDTLIDITDTTAQQSDVAQGKYFYLATGEKVQGSATGGGGGYPSVYQDENGYLVLDDEEGSGGLTIDQFIDHAYPQGAISTTATSMVTHTFRERTGITSFSASEMTEIGGYQFYHCTALESVYFPKLSRISTSNAFDGCTVLEGIVLPVISYMHTTSLFNGCSNMEYVDIGVPGITGLGSSNAFANCAKLNTIVLRRTAGVTAVGNISIFNGTPFASGGTGGTLYVPSALLSTYQSATNWSTILGYANNQIKAIENSYYETHYADGTVIS